MKSPKAIEALEKKLQNDFWVRRLKRREGQKVTIVICVNFSGQTSDILDERKPFSGVGCELIIIHTVETVNLWTHLMKIVLLLQVYNSRVIHFLFDFLFCHHSNALSVTSVITIQWVCICIMKINKEKNIIWAPLSCLIPPLQ